MRLKDCWSLGIRGCGLVRRKKVVRERCLKLRDDVENVKIFSRMLNG